MLPVTRIQSGHHGLRMTLLLIVPTREQVAGNPRICQAVYKITERKLAFFFSQAVGQMDSRYHTTSIYNIFFPLHLISPRSCRHLSNVGYCLSMLFSFSQESIFLLSHSQLWPVYSPQPTLRTEKYNNVLCSLTTNR